MKNLSDVKCGKEFKISSIDDKTPLKIKRRLLELGFTKGQPVCVTRKSLLSSSLLVDVRGYCICLRKDIAQRIILI